MTNQENDKLINAFRWIINVLILVVGFFISSKLGAIDTSFNDLEKRVRNLEFKEASQLERDKAILEKLDLIISKQTKWEKDIADFYYLNPDLKKPDVGN
jgi:hypothetical protein